MKFSSGEAHIWMQHALCQEAIGQHTRALAMMEEVIRLMKDETQPRLIAARIAYHSMNKVCMLHYQQQYFFDIEGSRLSYLCCLPLCR